LGYVLSHVPLRLWPCFIVKLKYGWHKIMMFVVFVASASSARHWSGVLEGNKWIPKLVMGVNSKTYKNL
jgi:hypothetical protein